MVADETCDVSIGKAKQQRFYVYILYSLRDKGWYIGFTTNLKHRLIEHTSGKVTATRFRTPLKLIHYEYFINKADAKARERFLKSGYGRQQIKAFLKQTIHELA
ncbi:MAG: GIY-YIG nuclease family protein [Patescibacteria group bacterium]